MESLGGNQSSQASLAHTGHLLRYLLQDNEREQRDPSGPCRAWQAHGARLSTALQKHPGLAKPLSRQLGLSGHPAACALGPIKIKTDTAEKGSQKTIGAASALLQTSDNSGLSISTLARGQTLQGQSRQGPQFPWQDRLRTLNAAQGPPTNALCTIAQQQLALPWRSQSLGLADIKQALGRERRCGDGRLQKRATATLSHETVVPLPVLRARAR